MAHLKSGFSVCGFAILFMIFLIVYTSAEYEHLFNNGNELCVGTNCPDRSGNGVSGAMWFGPRLGRRRRSDGIPTDHRNLMKNFYRDDTSAWDYASRQGQKRHSTQFTPRLGRELSDELLERIIAIDNEDNLIQELDTKSSDIDLHHELMQPPLSPPQFQPRLGRRQIYTPSSNIDYRLPEYLRNF